MKLTVFTALMNYQDDRIKAVAIAELKDPNSDYTGYAARYLVKAEGVAALGILIQGFSNPKEAASGDIGTVIAKEIGIPAVEPLIDALGNDNPAIQQGAKGTLGKIRMQYYEKSEVLAAFKKALKDYPNPTVRIELVGLLEGDAWKPEDVELLIHLLDNSEAPVREFGVRTLRRFKDPRGVDPLIKALSDPELRVAKAAIYTLGNSKDPRAFYPLAQRLNDKRFYGSVAEGLGYLMNDGVAVDPRAADSLIEAMSINDDSLIEPIIERALVAIGKSAVPLLEKALGEGDYRTRQRAARVLEEIRKQLGGVS